MVYPDLATDNGTVTNNGTTYTFHLKSGIMFGPPVNRPITSKDVAYAFQRINTKALVAQYGFYYDGVIKGMDGSAKNADTLISGIQTPDDSTIVFNLTQPTGDFLYRLTMPATAPIPQEVAKCFTTAGGYGRDLVSSGPYMFQGADAVDMSSCDSIKPMAGFDPTKFMKLVRNPKYDPKTDTTAMRQNFINGVDIEIDTNTSDIFNKIQSGQLDGSIGTAAAPGRAAVPDRPAVQGPAARRPGRPDLVHHHEPADAAVRRRACAKGGQLHHRQGVDPEGVGRICARRDRHPHHAAHRTSRVPRRLRPVRECGTHR